MGKQQQLKQVTLESLKPRDFRWKLGARLRYITEKKYSSNGIEKKLMTGIIEGQKRQMKINIWSEGGLADQLERNATYRFSKGKMEDGVINFGQHSEIERIEDDGMIPDSQLFFIRDLAALDNQERVIDFEAYVLHVGDVLSGITKDNRPYRKQIIQCCEPESELKVSLTMWDHFLDKSVELARCRFEGVKYKIYCESKQLNSTIFSKITMELTTPKMQESTASLVEWKNLSELYRQKTIMQLRQQLSNTNIGDNVYSQIRGHITSYIGEECFQECCQTCGIKLNEERECEKCGRNVQKGIKKLLLRFEVTDQSKDNIKIKCYNFISNKLLTMFGLDGISLEDLEKMDRNKLKEVFEPVVGKTMMMNIMSNIVQYDGKRFENHCVKDIF